MNWHSVATEFSGRASNDSLVLSGLDFLVSPKAFL
jgi:hypothetical protein